MYNHPHMAYQLARTRQDELRQLSVRRERRSSRRLLQRLRSRPQKASSLRPAPGR
jgi:hypothetical protein